MQLSLKNFKSILDAELLKKAAKNRVRECDELEKGHFQAYVDEREETYDTFLIFNKAAEVTGHECDCLNINDFCQHKAALIVFIANQKKTVTKLKLNKKINQIESVVSDADPEQLKTWLIELLHKNKDLELVFLHQFAPKNEQLTDKEIRQLTSDAVKSVVKNKRNIDIVSVKNIVKLWEVLHQTVIDDYCNHMNEEGAFNRLNAVMEACEENERKLITSSRRLTMYRDELLEKLLLPLSQIMDTSRWFSVVQYFVDHVVVKGAYGIRIYYLVFLVKLTELIDKERRVALVRDLVSQYMVSDHRQFYDEDRYTMLIFNLVLDNGLFDEYYIAFKPIHYSNNYNLQLIGKLIKNGSLALAESFCKEQIQENSNQVYDEPYLEFLIAIYTQEKDDQKLAGVFKQILPYRFDFQIYLFVYDRLNDLQERTSWRNELFTRSRKMAAMSDQAMLFSFELLSFEGNYERMTNLVDSSATYEVIIRYAEAMLLTNKKSFLKQLLNRADHREESAFEKTADTFIAAFTHFYEILLQHYSADELADAVKSSSKFASYYSPNQFTDFLKKKLFKRN